MAQLEIIGPADHAGVMICRMACIEKGIPHQHKQATASSRKLARENPLGAVPSLRHGKVRLFGVRGITSYVDSRFKGRNLLPADPIRAAEVEQWTAAILHRLDGLMDRSTCSQIAADSHVAKCLGMINDCIGHKFWLVGRGFTLADMALMPAINNLSRLLGHDQLLRQFPAIGLWFAKHSQRRSWQAVSPSEAASGANA
jgi:glutathione S-transferase